MGRQRLFATVFRDQSSARFLTYMEAEDTNLASTDEMFDGQGSRSTYSSAGSRIRHYAILCDDLAQLFRMARPCVCMKE